MGLVESLRSYVGLLVGQAELELAWLPVNPTVTCLSPELLNKGIFTIWRKKKK